MTIKKIFVTTSSFILTAALLSQIYSFKFNSDRFNSINYSAFNNLTQNIKSVSSNKTHSLIDSKKEFNNSDIIKLIDREISTKISRTSYSIRMINSPLKTVKKLIANTEVKKALPLRAIKSEDLSTFEINNSELINLYAMSVDKMAFTKFNSIIIDEKVKDEVIVAQASTTHEQIETDEVTTIQPAPERNDIAEEEVKESSDEEMVMFDYSDKPAQIEVVKTIDQKLYERPLSKTVQRAINREIGSAPIKKLESVNIQKTFPEASHQNLTKIDNQEIDIDSDENTTYDYSKQNNKTTDVEAKEAIAEANAFTSPPKAEDTQFVLRAKEINLNTLKRRQATSFEFVPDYDRSERSDDQGSGEIGFGYSLNGDMNTQTGIVQAQGMISTRVELNLGGKANFEVPLINEEGMQKFLQKKGLSIEGNLIMLAIDSSIVDTEIDSKFGEKFFFDKNFKTLSNNTGASFVLYAGVKSGNIMLRYLLNNKEISQKVVYVGEGEMYFEDAEFIDSNRETFTLTTRNLLGQKKKELIIDGEEISYFNTNITAKKKALNAYDIKIPALSSGMRKYLEFKHLKDSIIVGTSSENEIEIPGNDFINKVLEVNQVSSLKDRCVVQVNLSKDLREIKANGKNRSGEMFVESSYLDKDGNFSHDSFEMADKLFIVGDLEGQFNIKLDYTDGSTEFLKTFCTEGSYLVEQL